MARLLTVTVSYVYMYAYGKCMYVCMYMFGLGDVEGFEVLRVYMKYR